MKLFSYFRSSAAFRVRIALNLKGIVPDETAFVHLRRGEQNAEAYLEQNPQGLVPALKLGDGDVIGQSLAIIEYLDEVHPGPALLPPDPAGKALVRSLALLFACEIHPLQNLRVLNHLRGTMRASDAEANAWAAHWNRIGLTAYERAIAGSAHTGSFSYGDTPSIADICLVPQVFSAQRFAVDLSPFPNVLRIHSKCMTLPAFDLAQPSKQPDAEP